MGDERVTVNIETPTHLNKNQKEALKTFAKTSGKTVAGNGKSSLFDKLRGV